MAARHHRTMEAGGWVLLAAAIAWLLWLLFHKDGQAALMGQTQPAGSLSLRITEPPPTPSDPTQASTYVDETGQQYVWNVVGKQWHISSSQLISNIRLSQGAF